MVRIAVCDDDAIQRDLSKEYIEMYKARNLTDMEFLLFENGVKLLDYVEKFGGFDIYLLDLIMPEINGMEVAHKLRDNRDNGKIVFLTSTPDFVFDAFSVKANDYILKPIEPEKFFSILDKLLSEIIDESPVAVTIKCANGDRNVPIDNIVYIENVNRTPYYHLADETVIEGITTREKFSSLISIFLTDYSFALCNVGIAVNLKYVSAIKSNDLVLKNGKTFSCTRTMGPDFKKSLASYWKQ